MSENIEMNGADEQPDAKENSRGEDKYYIFYNPQSKAATFGLAAAGAMIGTFVANYLASRFVK